MDIADSDPPGYEPEGRVFESPQAHHPLAGFEVLALHAGGLDVPDNLGKITQDEFRVE